MPDNDEAPEDAQPMAGRADVTRMMADLRQPLTAASNYIGAARALAGTSEGPQTEAVLENLDKAGEQIIRAGQIIGELSRQLASERAARENPS